MKNVVILLVSGAMGILLLVMVQTLGGNMNRSVELREILSTALEGAVKRRGQEAGSADAWTLHAECMQSMAFAMDADADAEVKVYRADAQKGMLSLGITACYIHPNGAQGDTSWKRTVLCEKKGEKNRVNNYKVIFYENKEALEKGEFCYKTYTVAEQARIPAPAAPKAQGRTFAGWRDRYDYIADFSQPVCGNLCYYAAWE